jgi:type II secretory pathway component GspD/PulD (secretin)
MRKNFRTVFFCILFLLPFIAEGQAIKKMDFRNQNIADILMVLADMGQQSVIIDPSVTGTATFYFSDSEFEEALFQFVEACNLFCEKRNNAYYVSKMQISLEGELITALAEDIDIETLVKSISRSAGKTILYDSLPKATISIREQRTALKDLLEIITKKYPDYSVLEENDAFYLKRTVETASSSSGRLSATSIMREGDLYSMNIQRASFTSIITQLFRTSAKEYSLLQRTDVTLENLYFDNKPFNQLLRLVLEQANCDFVESNDIYYIFEIQRRDVLKNLKNIIVLQLKHVPVEEAAALLPSDYSGSTFLKINKNTNSVYLTGSTEEIQPISDFFALLDVPAKDKLHKRFEVHYLKVNDFLSLLPKELSAAGPLVIPDSNAFVVQLSEEMIGPYKEYLELIDKINSGIPIHLKYIKSDELIQNLPPSVLKEEIVVSTDPTLIFYKGTAEKQTQFLDHLKLIDQPKPQIRYQLLVIQYQRSENLNWNRSLSVNPPDYEPSSIVSGTFSNLLNISFDIVSGFGQQLAINLNLQLGEDKAKVLADTTLNGISGQDIKFENTNTFRYRDTTIDPETGKPFYTGVTREITSGLVLGINGWVSGDGMITMQVNAAVSKQDESGANTSATTNPPPTSERVVNTQVRTKSGTPIVIGGLLQIEKNESIRKTPILGSIPLLGRLFRDTDIQEITTEMVIYIVPYVHSGESGAPNFHKKNEEYFKKYILHEM